MDFFQNSGGGIEQEVGGGSTFTLGGIALCRGATFFQGRLRRVFPSTVTFISPALSEYVINFVSN